MKYWVYLNGEVPGCYAPEELAAMPDVSAATLICPAEGEILEKNWKQAAEFSSVVQLLKDRPLPPAPAALAAPGSEHKSTDLLIDAASSRLFSHVSALMKELSASREERTLALSLQEQLSRAMEDLRLQKEKASRVAELEEGLAQMKGHADKARAEASAMKARLDETLANLAVRNHLIEKLNHDLIDKEQSLSKALSVMHRLEEDLRRLLPKSVARPAPAPAPHDPPAVSPETAKPPHPAVAHEALVHRFKKLVGKYDN